MSTTHNTPTIGTFLDVSTSAITKEEDQILRATAKGLPGHDDLPLNVCEHGYGYWVWTGTTEGEVRETLPNLYALLSYARQHGCRFVNLDCDGADVPGGLPTFTW